MLKTQDKIFLSWDDVTQLVDNLCHQILTNYPQIDSIYGVPRGGLIPAIMVSHKLNIPWTNTMYANTLVIDDICDTGNTLKNIYGAYTAVLHYKPHTSCYVPDLCAEEHNGNEFIYYPWERNDALPLANYLNK
jgi:hypoxanthine phosphoribosyltransferase